MEITYKQFKDMEVRYNVLVRSLPDNLQCPTFEKFLSPANLINFRFNYYDNEELTLTADKRWRMLESPHARTLLLAWALQRFTHENDNQNADHHL